MVSLLMLSILIPVITIFTAVSAGSVTGSKVQGNDGSPSGDYRECNYASSHSTCSWSDFGTSIELSHTVDVWGDQSGTVVFEPQASLETECVNSGWGSLSFTMRYDTHSTWGSSYYEFDIYDFDNNEWDEFSTIGSASTAPVTRTWMISPTSTNNQQTTGYYLNDASGTNTEIKVRVSVDDSSEMEIDWVQLELREETDAPTSPADPDYNGFADGPDTWSNDNQISSIDFDDSGYDECEYDRTEYVLDHVPLSQSPSSLSCSSPSGQTQSTSSDNRISSSISFSQSGWWRLCWQAVDGFGNRGSWNSDDFWIDLDAPSIPVITTTSSPTYWNEGQVPAIEWLDSTDSSGSGVDYYEVRVNNVLRSTITDDGSSSFSFTPSRDSGLTCIGNNTIQITAYDEAGNAASPANHTLYYDDCQPNNTTHAASSGWYNVSNPNLDFNNPGDDGSGIQSFQMNINDAGWSQFSGPVTGSIVQFRPTLPDGENEVQLRFVDGATSPNTRLGPILYVDVDTVAPILNGTIHSHQSVWSTNHLVNISLTSTDDNPYQVDVSGLNRMYLTITNSAANLTSSQVRNSPDLLQNCYSTLTSCNVSYTGTLGNGSWGVWAVGVDNASNEVLIRLPGNILIDSSNPLPTQPSIQGINVGGYTNSSTQFISWPQAIDNHSGISHYQWALSSNLTAMAANTTNANNMSLSLADGEYEFCLRPVDLAGNVGPARCTNPFIVDQQAATLLMWTDNAGGWLNRSNITLTWNASDSCGSVVTSYRVTPGMTNWFSLNSSGSKNIANLASGYHDLQIQAVDCAGNVAHLNQSIQIDTLDPHISSFGATLNANGWSSTNTIALAWNATDVHSGITSVSVHAPALNMTWNMGVQSNGTSVTLPDGVNQTLTLRIMDGVGRVTEQQITVSVDTTSVQTSCSVLPSTWTNSSVEFWFTVVATGPSPVEWNVRYENNQPIYAPASPVTIHLPPEHSSTFTLQASNAAGSSSVCTATAHADRTSPIILTPPNIPQRVNTSLVNVSFAAVDIHSGISTIELLVNGNTTSLIADLPENHTATRYLSIPTVLQPGQQNTIQVRLTDFAGQVTTWSTVVICDVQPPSIQFSVRDAFSWHNSGSTIAADWTVTDDLDPTPLVRLEVDGVIQNHIMATTGTGSILSFVNLSNGNHNLRLVATDANNNTAFSDTITVRVDATTPTCNLTSSHSPAWNSTTQRELNISAIGGPSPLSYTLEIDDQTLSISPGLLVRSFEHGTTTVRMKATSAAGLACSQELIQRVDNEAPQIRWFIVEENYHAFGDGNAHLSWNVSMDDEGSDTTLELWVNGRLNASGLEYQTDDFLFPDLSNGVYIFELVITDEANSPITWTREIDVLRDTFGPTIECNDDGTTIPRKGHQNTIIPQIECVLNDRGFPINLDEINIQIWVDDQPLSTSSDTDSAFFSLGRDQENQSIVSTTIHLPDNQHEFLGPHTLKINVFDKLGNPTNTTMDFDVTGLLALSSPWYVGGDGFDRDPGKSLPSMYVNALGHNATITSIEVTDSSGFVHWNSTPYPSDFVKGPDLLLPPGTYDFVVFIEDYYRDSTPFTSNFTIHPCDTGKRWNDTRNMCENYIYSGPRYVHNSISIEYPSLSLLFDERTSDINLDSSNVRIGNTTYFLNESTIRHSSIGLEYRLIIDVSNLSGGPFNLTIDFVDQNGVHYHESIDEIPIENPKEKPSDWTHGGDYYPWIIVAILVAIIFVLSLIIIDHPAVEFIRERLP